MSKIVFRYACVGFRRLFSRKTVSHAPHGWRFGECAEGKGDKKIRVARWTARKINGSYLFEYNPLNSISLPKPLPVSFRLIIGNESDSTAVPEPAGRTSDSPRSATDRPAAPVAAQPAAPLSEEPPLAAPAVRPDGEEELRPAEPVGEIQPLRRAVHADEAGE